MSLATSSSTGRRSKTPPRVLSHAGRGTSSSRISGWPVDYVSKIPRASALRALPLASFLPRRKRAAGGFLLLEPQRPVRLHERVNVASALVDDRSLAVAQIPLHRIIVRIAVSAVNFNRHRRSLFASRCGLPLRQTR